MRRTGVAEAFATVQHILRIVSAAVIILLLVVSLLIISNTVKLAMYDRRDEIAIMKMVGATNAFIRFPFIVQGFLLGITGAAIGFFFEWGLYDLLASKIATVDTLQLITIVPFTDVLPITIATYALCGFAVGVMDVSCPSGSSCTYKVWRKVMRSGKNNKLVSTIALVLVIVMALSVLLGSLATMVSAESSSALKSKLGDLKDQAAEIAAKADALEQEIAANQSETQSIVDKKAGIDQKMELTRQEIANLNEQITQYNLLIASKQEELDEALAQEEQMNETYQVRLRAMEENGSVSYWSILFGASSFTDLLDRVDMMIAQSDINMIEQMKAVAHFHCSRPAAQDSKQELELSKLELADLEQQLALERAEADQLITQLMAKSEELIATSKEYDTMEDELRQQILLRYRLSMKTPCRMKKQQEKFSRREKMLPAAISRQPTAPPASNFRSPRARPM